MEIEIFIESFAPPPRLIIFGAVDFTAALASAGKLLGFHVMVCDARAGVRHGRRGFPWRTRSSWNGRTATSAASATRLGPRDAVCVLTHDTKFDVPAVLGRAADRVGYIGAMGSRRTHEARWKRLLEAGADEAELRARLMSPIGLDIGARTPEETAIAICAEIVAVRARECRRAVAAGRLRAYSPPVRLPASRRLAGRQRWLSLLGRLPSLLVGPLSPP